MNAPQRCATRKTSSLEKHSTAYTSSHISHAFLFPLQRSRVHCISLLKNLAFGNIVCDERNKQVATSQVICGSPLDLIDFELNLIDWCRSVFCTALSLSLSLSLSFSLSIIFACLHSVFNKEWESLMHTLWENKRLSHSNKRLRIAIVNTASNQLILCSTLCRSIYKAF